MRERKVAVGAKHPSAPPLAHSGVLRKGGRRDFLGVAANITTNWEQRMAEVMDRAVRSVPAFVVPNSL